MVWLLYPLAMVGSIVVGGALWLFFSEVWRAVRQTNRVFTVQRRLAEAPVSLKYWWRWFLHELGSCCDYEIGPFEIPNNPKKPIRRTRDSWGFPSEKQRDKLRQKHEAERINEEAEARAHWAHP